MPDPTPHPSGSDCAMTFPPHLKKCIISRDDSLSGSPLPQKAGETGPDTGWKRGSGPAGASVLPRAPQEGEPRGPYAEIHTPEPPSLKGRRHDLKVGNQEKQTIFG